MKTLFTMKNPFLMIIPFAMALNSFVSQTTIDDVIAALRTGSAPALAKYFDNYIDITLPDKSNNYSKSQAELIIKDFFSINEVKGFEVKHKGSNDNGEYCIGTLQTKNGHFRTTVYMRLKGNRQVIQDIRIQ